MIVKGAPMNYLMPAPANIKIHPRRQSRILLLQTLVAIILLASIQGCRRATEVEPTPVMTELPTTTRLPVVAEEPMNYEEGDQFL